jgi:ubiquinone/menaquinone biosynthesis C-methylase UbiE
MDATANYQLWERQDIAQVYTEPQALQPAEQSIVHALRSILPKARMLDMGVGAGRTTAHFAPLVADYRAMDYSAAMVETTRQRFPALRERITVVDARDMHGYDSESFDFVLFSYNGIDYVSPEDRVQALREMVRVTKPSGFLAFSTHNLHCAIPPIFDFNREDGIRYGVRRTITRLRFEASNPTFRLLRNGRNAMAVRDPAHDFGLSTLYVDPAAQVQQLHALGLWDVHLYGKNGQRVSTDTADPGVYFLARRH